MKSYEVVDIRKRYDSGNELSNTELGIMFQHYIDTGEIQRMPEQYLRVAQWLFLLGVVNLPASGRVTQAIHDSKEAHSRVLYKRWGIGIVVVALAAWLLPLIFLAIVHNAGL